MRCRLISLAFCLGVCLMMAACSPGVYVKMDSTAPERTPVFIGMKRYDAEMHLGRPLFISRLKEDQYRGIYEYEANLSARDTIYLDIFDFTTMGLGNLIVTPLDRSKGRRYLVAVIYQMDDQYVSNDRVIGIKEGIKISLK